MSEVFCIESRSYVPMVNFSRALKSIYAKENMHQFKYAIQDNTIG